MKILQRWYNMAVAAALAGSLFSSCDEDSRLPVAESLVPIGINTRADGDGLSGSGGTARLLFWTEPEFHNVWMADAETASPYFVCELDNSINTYNHGKLVYPTGHKYLGNNTPLHATGYAPSAALTPAVKDGKEDYSVLAVNESCQDGLTDFLSCDGNNSHVGWEESPFTEQEHELKFRHLTACISFEAKRGSKMLGSVGVNKVKVTVKSSNGLKIPVSFGQYVKDEEVDNTGDQSTYIIKETIPQGDIAIGGTDENYIRADETRTVGNCYVTEDFAVGNGYDPFASVTETEGTKDLSIDVSADYYLITYGTDGELQYQFLRTASWDNENVSITTTTGDKFYPGYRYVVTITFNSDEILLEGKPVPWEDGGEHYLPVYPKEEPAG